MRNTLGGIAESPVNLTPPIFAPIPWDSCLGTKGVPIVDTFIILLDLSRSHIPHDLIVRSKIRSWHSHE